jgi:hypothetical protein
VDDSVAPIVQPFTGSEDANLRAAAAVLSKMALQSTKTCALSYCLCQVEFAGVHGSIVLPVGSMSCPLTLVRTLKGIQALGKADLFRAFLIEFDRLCPQGNCIIDQTALRERLKRLVCKLACHGCGQDCSEFIVTARAVCNTERLCGCRHDFCADCWRSHFNRTIRKTN